ncbi:family 16 glycosylhydrolase [Asinibacterium sp. OR53]|uniref:glycoside hydrolase family 16 protein n=1 Tax=Asinibacterium sp. OR53 TaxID=925409 RepID=UPI0018DB5E72|nr:glycoside hydrolase family 16 protein [Asinibacterium sp. OR53]
MKIQIRFFDRPHLLRTAGCAILFLLSGCSKGQPASNATSNPNPGTGGSTKTYQLVWADEFNGTSLDSTNWVFDIGGNGWGNNELEYYQKANATVVDGNLVITAKKETVGNNPYTSSRLKTQGKQSFTYGRIEARIKMPVGQGLWPAFWLLGTNISSVGWPKCGEIDIMEHINADSLIYGTAHAYDNGQHVSSGDKMLSSPATYHVYDVEWDAYSITWHIDGTLYHTVNLNSNINSTGAFFNPFFIIFNLAVGGNWPGSQIDDTRIPASMYVDYVRVYQLK